MKILWLCSWYPHSRDPFDGDFVERHARSLATCQKVDVLHIVQNKNLLRDESFRIEERQESNMNVKICFIPAGNLVFGKINALLFNFHYFKTMRSLLNEYIDKNGIPDIVHVHVPVKMGAGAIWLKKKFKIPFAVTEHATIYFQKSHDNYFDRGFQFKYLTKKTFNEADAVISVSECLMRVMSDLFIIKQKHLIRNSVNTEIFFPVKSNNLVKKFIHVSMMVPFKNIEGILEGLALLSKRTTNWQMVFVGPANAEQAALAKEFKLDRQVVWKGALPYADVAKEMQHADALVHFSTYENLPCVISEALCCGIPVISSNVGGISELVNEKNGILVKNRNVEQLAEAMETFLNFSEKFDKEEISNSASAQFNYKTIGTKMTDVYKEILAVN